MSDPFNIDEILDNILGESKQPSPKKEKKQKKKKKKGNDRNELHQ